MSEIVEEVAASDVVVSEIGQAVAFSPSNVVVEADNANIVTTEESSHSVVETESATVVTEEVIVHEVITETLQGPPGPPGPAGAAGPGGGYDLQEFSRLMDSGVVLYTLPELPVASMPVVAYINGVKVSITVAGVNVTITEYSPGTIEASDELTILYYH